MKAKLMSFMAGLLVLVIILFTGPQCVTAASKGELTIAASMLGNETLVPYTEHGHAVDFLKMMYDPLFGSTPDGELSTGHSLADKWQMSADGRTWTIHIRNGVKFHDGVGLTAKDVKFSMELMMLPASKGTYTRTIRRLIKNIEIKDSHTIVIHLKKPSLFFPHYFADTGSTHGFIQPKDRFEKVGYDEFSKHPIGTGPYKYHSSMAGSFIKMEAVDKHWRDGVPRYKYVTFRIIPEETTKVAMLKTGEADIARVSRYMAKKLKKEGFNIVSKKDYAVVLFYCNMQYTNPVFMDIKFRKALNLAINKEAIIKHIFDGMAKPVGTYPGKTIAMVGGKDLSPYPYDPEEARRLLKEGGYEGYEFPIPSYPRAGCPEYPKVLETVCGYWEKVGLKPKISMTEYSSWRKKMRSGKTQNHISGSDFGAAGPAFVILSRLEDKFLSTRPNCIHKAPELDKLIKSAHTTLDETEMKKLTRGIYRYTYDQYLWIPICNIDDKIATTKRVPKWDPGLRRMDRNLNDIIRQR